MEVYQVGRNPRTQPREQGLEEVLLCKWNNLCSFLNNTMQGSTCLLQGTAGSGSVGLRGLHLITPVPLAPSLPASPLAPCSSPGPPAPLSPLGDTSLPGRLWRPPLAAHSTLVRPRLSSTFLWFSDQLTAQAPPGTAWQEGEGMSPYASSEALECLRNE